MNKETHYLNNYLGLRLSNCTLSRTLIELRTNRYVGVKIRTVQVKILRDFSFSSSLGSLMVCSHLTTPRTRPTTIIMGSTVMCRALHTAPRPYHLSHFSHFISLATYIVLGVAH